MDLKINNAKEKLRDIKNGKVKIKLILDKKSQAKTGSFKKVIIS